MKTLMVLLVMSLGLSPAFVNAQENVWKLDTEGQANASVSASGRNQNLNDIKNLRIDHYTARQVYIKYGDTFVIRPFFSWWGDKDQSPYKQCSGDDYVGEKSLGIYPIKVNEEWIKFAVNCECNETSAFMQFIPQTLLDANKLQELFMKYSVVSFINADMSAKGYTKTHNELRKIYGLDFK